MGGATPLVSLQIGRSRPISTSARYRTRARCSPLLVGKIHLRQVHRARTIPRVAACLEGPAVRRRSGGSGLAPPVCGERFVVVFVDNDPARWAWCNTHDWLTLARVDQRHIEDAHAAGTELLPPQEMRQSGAR